jgi:chemotaxis response regulator CheB
MRGLVGERFFDQRAREMVKRQIGALFTGVVDDGRERLFSLRDELRAI